MSAHPPDGFSWVVPGVLAAMSRPVNMVASMEYLREEGIGVIISLTETPLSPALIEEFGFGYYQIPIRDFTAPTAGQISKFVRLVEGARKSGGKCIVHCLAGKGRTGTMVACYLVSRGKSAQEALAQVRTVRPGSVETAEQEDAVARYERRLSRKERPRRRDRS